MNRIVMKSKVSSDGVLHLQVPVGIAEADQEVRVTVDPIPSDETLSAAEWRSWVEAMAGSWQGDFDRPPQGDYETRDSLP
jgi:hypothetical protein